MQSLDLSIERRQYEEFCKQYLEKVYMNNTPEWLNKACIKGDWKAKYAEKDGKILGVWPYFITRKRGMVSLNMPTFNQSLDPIPITLTG